MERKEFDDEKKMLHNRQRMFIFHGYFGDPVGLLASDGLNDNP
ncbi:MAG: hypothetical protein WBY88_17960 [Desulfosarcina sp.]